MQSRGGAVDAASVSAAGATMDNDPSVLGNAWVLDEDNFASNSDTKVPTQQSTKAYIASVVAGGVSYQGAYNASTNTPDLDTAPTGIGKGYMYTVTVAGTFFTIAVEVGDVLISEIVNPTVEADWTIVNKNIDPFVSIDLTGTVWVDVNGSDITGIIGDPAYPFETIEGAETAISSPGSGNQYILNLGPGTFDITGLVKKPYIHWQGQGKMATLITASAPVDLTFAAMNVQSSDMMFKDLRLNPVVEADMYSIGGTGISANFLFINCLFGAHHEFTGRGTTDSVIYYNSVIESTPNTWTSVALQLWSSYTTGDGGSGVYVIADNGNAAQAFIFGTLMGSPMTVQSVGGATCFCACRGSIIGGTLTVDGSTTTMYLDSGAMLGGTPSVTGGATLTYVSNTGQITNTSTVSGTLLEDALDTLQGLIDNLDSDAVANASAVTGTTVSDALDQLNTDIGNLGSDDIANDSTVTGTTVTDALDELKNVSIEITATTQQADVNRKYITNNASLVTVTLPVTANVGDFVWAFGSGAGGWKIAQNSGQKIHFVGSTSTTGTSGYASSITRYDCIKLTCIIADTDWVVDGAAGSINIV